MPYQQLKDGEGFSVKDREVLRFACCDCGLVHRVAFVVDGKLIGIALARDKKSTRERRRQKGIKWPQK